jgi:hypothetical protein
VKKTQTQNKANKKEVDEITHKLATEICSMAQ